MVRKFGDLGMVGGRGSGSFPAGLVGVRVQMRQEKVGGFFKVLTTD